MCDLFALNYGGPLYSSIKRENKKGVQFIAGKDEALFAEIANIYIEAKKTYCVEGHIHIILVEDETMAKSRIVRKVSSHRLVGFYGSKDCHGCVSNFKPIVGSGNASYKAIVNAFVLNKKGSFAKVIIVNPLHALLPRLLLVFLCTCNCFDFHSVRRY